MTAGRFGNGAQVEGREQLLKAMAHTRCYRCAVTLGTAGTGMARGNFGERLKRERELREVSWEELTSATRIGPKFLEALENEEWEKLPGGVFNRGFVRSIARYLGLNEEVLLGEYDLAHGVPAPSPNGQPAVVESPASPRWKPVVVFVLGALLLLAAIVVSAFYLWRHFGTRHTAKQTAATIRAPATAQTPGQPSALVVATSASLPSSSPGSPTNAQDTGPLDLLVIAKAPTHLLVLADGRVAFYDEIRVGERHHFGAEDNFEITAADCGAVLLEMNGQAMPMLGPPGSSGTMKLKHDDLRQAPLGNTQR
jgi:cytoskeleton protein RodZ